MDGTIKWWKQIAGDYYSVDPLDIGSYVDALTNKARCAVESESEGFDRVLFVAIGASEVGTARQALRASPYLDSFRALALMCAGNRFNEKFRTPGQSVDKGEELGGAV